MGTLTVSMFCTLDGIIQAPGQTDEDPEGGFEHGGWQAPFFGGPWGEAVLAGIERMDAMLLGRKTYDIFARHWPEQPADDPIAPKFNVVPKFVASRTLKDPSWENTSVLGRDLAAEIAKLKEEHAHVQTFGSADLVLSLMQGGLVDRFTLYIHPLVLGTGKRLFPENIQPAHFRLVDSRAFSDGVVLLEYAPDGAPDGTD